MLSAAAATIMVSNKMPLDRLLVLTNICLKKLKKNKTESYVEPMRSLFSSPWQPIAGYMRFRHSDEHVQQLSERDETRSRAKRYVK